MLEHELLFTPAVQRPLYSARNDDVHLRLRVKLTVIDHGNRQQQQGDVDTKRKRRKSHHNSENNANMDTTTGDTEMLSSTQEIEKKETQSTAEGANPSGMPLQASLASTAGDPSQSTTMTSATATTTEEPLNGYRHSGSKTIVTRQYQLCQYGHPEPGRTIVVRSAILVRLHGDAFGFLSLLGYGFEDEFVRRGYNFMYNNICRISVFRKYKLSKQHDPFSAIVPEEEAAGGHAADTASPWLVEISSSFVSQENVNTMSDEINVVRNLLAASVTF
ncbi:hypothetical protein BGX34_009295 [Mortierella sp. NVP85]|nr:hypothetical protein BGX34_009295 [Mortierella sp. NVP85]